MKRIYRRPEDAPQEYWDSDASWLDVPCDCSNFLSLPRVCRSIGGEPHGRFVYTLTTDRGLHNEEFFLWALYRHAFESDEELPARDCFGYSERVLCMEDVIREVEEGALAECAIARAMELLL